MNVYFKVYITFIIVNLINPFAHAIIDMRNANYANTWTDLKVPGSGYDLRIQRTYNSRSLQNGLFGFGWCSDFETKLDVTAEGNLKVTECGGGLEVLYTASEFKDSKINDTIKTIMAEVKKKNPKQNPKFFAELENDLKDNHSLREEFTRQMNLKGEIKAGKVYKANGRETENIVFADSKYKRSLEDGTFQVFQEDGRISAMYDRNGNHLKFSWKGEILLSVVDSNGRKLSFSYNDQKRLKTISAPGGVVVSYKFDSEDLVQVTNAWKNTFTYKYDKHHNLTRIDYPDKTYKELKYNVDKDWVTSFRNRKGCIESYTYDVDKENPKDHYWSIVEKKCEGKVTNKSTYEFFHRTRPDGLAKYLYRVKADNNGELVEVVYHDIFGKPISIIRNNSKTLFSYFDNGLLKRKEEPLRNLDFQYDKKCNKVSQVIAEYFVNTPIKSESKGKEKRDISSNKKQLQRKISSNFSYDNSKCNLVFAKNSFGQTAKLNYDTEGRISKIEDQSQKIVNIKYDPRFSKPHIIHRPGLGTIKVTYKSDGEIEKVDSKEGSTVAVQVASIFSNLLEIIAPATTELSL